MTSCKTVCHILSPQQSKSKLLVFIEWQRVGEVQIVIVFKGIDKLVFRGVVKPGSYFEVEFD